jgi:hypothetical protein
MRQTLPAKTTLFLESALAGVVHAKLGAVMQHFHREDIGVVPSAGRSGNKDRVAGVFYPVHAIGSRQQKGK